MSKAKKANYGAEAVASLEAGYNPDSSQEDRDSQVKALAAELGKSVPSIRQKLQVMGVYVAKTYRTKSGNPTESKGAIVDLIAAACGVDDEDLLSLSKGTKNALSIVRDTLADFMSMIEADQADEIEDTPAEVETA